MMIGFSANRLLLLPQGLIQQKFGDRGRNVLDWLQEQRQRRAPHYNQSHKNARASM